MENLKKCIINFYPNRKDIKKTSYILVTLKEKEDNQIVLSICGSTRKNNGFCQCLDQIKESNNNPLFNRLYRLWKNYHLNDMHPGTEKQEKALKEAREKQLTNYDYSENCKYLESINLLYDNGYKYGTKWLYREIPQNDLQLINNIIDMYK